MIPIHTVLFYLAAAAPTNPTPPGTPTWVTVVTALIAMLGGTLGWEVYKRWRKGTQEDALEISQAAIEQARSAKDLFVQYRVELESAQKQIAQYLEQLIQVNRLLGEANGRIARLEIELRSAHDDTTDIRTKLERALREREEANEQREQLMAQVLTLQSRVNELERGTTHELKKVHDALPS